MLEGLEQVASNPSQGGTPFPVSTGDDKPAEKPEGKQTATEQKPGEGEQKPVEGKPEDTHVELKLDDTKPAPKAPQEQKPGEVKFTYEPTGDAGLDYALAFVGNLGYGDSHPAIVAAREGDFGLIKAELASKGVQGADQVLALAEQAYKGFVERDAKAQAELSNFAFATAGSKENWQAVHAWAKANADPAEKQQINAALSQGGIAAQSVIKFLVDKYAEVNTLNKPERSAVKESAAAAPSTPDEPMTARKYAAEVRELSRKLRGRLEGSPEYAKLQAARLAARKAGH